MLGPDTEAVDELLARQFGVEVEVIQQHTARLSHGDLSLDAPVGGDDSDLTMLDGISASDTTPEDVVGWAQRDELVHGTVRRMWSGLDERERAVVKHRLLDDDGETTLSDLGERFGLSRERLRQIEARVKDRLRRAMEAESLTLH